MAAPDTTAAVKLQMPNEMQGHRRADHERLQMFEEQHIAAEKST